jgi:exopolysaccharide production protein ExoZ
MMNANAGRSGVFLNVQAARALAALAVVAYHVGVLPFGQCGVDVFFVISGFIMSHAAPGEGQRFLLKRLIRICPLYWLSTIGVYLIATIKPQWLNTTTAGMSYLLKSLLFIPYIKENGHWGPLNLNGWTLEFEMFFYLVIAVALTLVRPRWATATAALALAAYCVFAATVEPANLVIAYFGQPFLLEFCLGVAAYWFMQSGIGTRMHKRLWLCVAVLALAIMPVAFYLNGAPYGFTRTVAYGLPSCAFIVALLAIERGGWAVRSAVIARLGAASYAIYLLHPYVVGMLKKIMAMHTDLHSASSVLAVVAVIAVVCVIGDVCHRYVEVPMLRFLNRRLAGGKMRKASAL